jgi:four helix bundle protein
LEMAVALWPALDQIEQRDRDLTDQIRRAAASVVLNIAEGAQRSGKDRLHCFRIAAGSAAEVRAGLTLAQAWGYLDSTGQVQVETLLDRVLAMLWRLTHARG